MFKLLKKLDKKGVSPVVATVLLIALTVAAGAVIWVVVRNYLGNTQGLATLNVEISANRYIQADSDGHNNIIQLTLTISVSGAESVIIDKIYLKNTGTGWLWTASTTSLNGRTYWEDPYRTMVFSTGSETFRTVATSRDYTLDFAYTGGDTTTYDHTTLNLATNGPYNWELYIEFHLPGETSTTLQSYATISTPF